MAETKYKNGKPQIDAYELPIVPVMTMPTYTEDWRFSEMMLAELNEMESATEGTSIAVKWAIQMIAELQACWIDAIDRLHKIEELSKY